MMLYSLYMIIIYPIELLLQFLFAVIYENLHSAFYAIVGVSLVVNTLLLPLYNRADSISMQERKKQESMSGWIKHIKKSFKGDERFMMLQTYYRKQDYHPLHSLRSSVSLLLQIPFFVAAYHFLSNLRMLKGYPFHWIADLGQPDRLLSVAGFTINLLPVLMTVINVVSIIIYTKGLPLREKLQLYIMAALFLVLLYDSPSGLVIYLIINNIFSLGKNIVLNIRKKDYKGTEEKKEKDRKDTEKPGSYICGIILMTLLTGVVIPSSVVVSSPEEFVTLTVFKDPLQYVFSTLMISAGFFILWLSIFYFLMSKKVRYITRLFLWILCGISLLDFLAFGKVPITLSSELVYRSMPVYGFPKIALNMILIIVLAAAMYIIWSLKPGITGYIYAVLIMGLVFLGAVNIVQTERQISDMGYLKNADDHYEGFTLSKKGRNVAVIMLDCAIGPYIPYIMNEKPELLEKYRGFTWYSNTLSYGGHTVIGSPGLFGGYGYTPEAMDSRPDEALKDKHDEALLVMPRLFSEAGFKTTVYDPPLAGYNDVSDLTIYDPYPEIAAYSLKNRFVSSEIFQFTESYRKRQFAMYSFYKTLPLILQPWFYYGGTYHYLDSFNDFVFSDVNTEFNDSYSILKNLNGITRIENTDEDTFMMMDNDTTHDVCELQLPDYVPASDTDNTGLEKGFRTDAEGNVMTLEDCTHYYVDVAALTKIGEWLDYLRKNDVYDNTRIILVADHGAGGREFENTILPDGTDVAAFCPLLMYKDFGADSFEISETFMTNADTPTLAMKDLINDPVNPFTGLRVDDRDKYDHPQLVLSSYFTELDRNTFKMEGQDWYLCRDNVYDPSDWEKVP